MLTIGTIVKPSDYFLRTQPSLKGFYGIVRAILSHNSVEGNMSYDIEWLGWLEGHDGLKYHNSDHPLSMWCCKEHQLEVVNSSKQKFSLKEI